MVHTDEDVDRTLTAADEALGTLASERLAAG
jgi:hypothetical protein